MGIGKRMVYDDVSRYMKTGSVNDRKRSDRLRTKRIQRPLILYMHKFNKISATIRRNWFYKWKFPAQQFGES